MQFLTGAAVFASGGLFGAWMILAGQNSQKNRNDQYAKKFRDVLTKAAEKTRNDH